MPPSLARSSSVLSFKLGRGGCLKSHDSESQEKLDGVETRVKEVGSLPSMELTEISISKTLVGEMGWKWGD
jgi:hypothetical protein